MASGCAGCVAPSSPPPRRSRARSARSSPWSSATWSASPRRPSSSTRRTCEAILGPYYERVRSELERHGGTVEKFIGDAVMALFGAPTAHEDDPERAVRAALAIRDFALEEGTRAARRHHDRRGSRHPRSERRRGGVHGLRGRRQYCCPPAERRPRQRDPRRRDDLPRDTAGRRLPRGRSCRRERQGGADRGLGGDGGALALRRGRHPPCAHRARRARARALDSAGRASSAPARSGLPQLVTLVAVPGMGKSRLVYELGRMVDSDPEMVTWRQGHCLAYGDGVAFWALAEVVKAQAGILEGEREGDAAEKLHAAVGRCARGRTRCPLGRVPSPHADRARSGDRPRGRPPRRGLRCLASLP